MGDIKNTSAETPQQAQIELVVGDRKRHVTYEQAFAFGCTLLGKGHFADAGKVFERLEQFSDRGPRAFIMQAFCEAAALHFADCSRPLSEAFDGEAQGIAAALHNAFVSFHVGIREDALNSMIQIVNEHPDLPTLCLLLGDMCAAANQLPTARKCWSRAARRDRSGGAVAAVAVRHLKQPPVE